MFGVSPNVTLLVCNGGFLIFSLFFSLSYSPMIERTFYIKYMMIFAVKTDITHMQIIAKYPKNIYLPDRYLSVDKNDDWSRMPTFALITFVLVDGILGS